MIKILEKMFAFYYFFYVKKRRFNRRHHLRVFDRSEDSGALATLILAEMFLIAAVAGIIRKVHFFVMRKEGVWIILIPFGLAIFIQNRYFISNSDRRRDIIEGFRDLPEQKKTLWNLISIGIIIVPFISFFFLLRK